MIAGCDDNHGNDDSNTTPDINSNQRYASVRYISLSDNSINFGNQVTRKIATRSITFSNPLKNYPIKFSLASLPSNITIDYKSTCGRDNSIIYPGDACSFIFLLSKNEIGNYSDNIVFKDEYDRRNIATTANIIADTSPITIDNYYHSFGEVELASTTAVVAKFKVMNTRNSAILIKIDALNSPFFITPFSTCNEGINTLQPLASCNIILHFLPSYINVYNNNLILNVDGHKVPISITGVGKRRYTDINSLVLSKNMIDYGTVEAGDFKISSVRVTNSANNEYLKFFLPDMPDNFSYEQSSTCGIAFRTLHPKQFCDLFIKYEPKNANDDNNDNNLIDRVDLLLWVDQSYKSLPLISNTINKNAVDISPKQLDLKNIHINKETITFLTVKNVSLIDQNITITLPAGFKLIDSNDSNKRLIPDESYRVGVQFTPTVIDNMFSAEIKINIDDYYYTIPISAYITNENYIKNTQLAPRTSAYQNIVGYDDKIIYYNASEDNDNKTYIYSLSQNIWEKVAHYGIKLPDNLTASSLSIFNDALYLFGGIDNNDRLYNSLHAFDLILKSWRSVVIKDGTLLPPARKDHTTTVLNDKLYLFGGIDNISQNLNDLWVFDFNDATHSWSKLDLPTNIDTSNTKSVLLSSRNSLYLVTERGIYRYTPNRDIDWINIYTLSNPLVELISSVLSGSDIYILGNLLDSKVVLYRLNIMNTMIQLDELDISDLSLDSDFSLQLVSHISGSAYIFQIYDDKNINKAYKLNRFDDTFDKVNLYQQPDILGNYISTSISDTIYYITELKDLFSYNISEQKFNYLPAVGCDKITDNFTLASLSDKIYQIDGTENICIFNTITEEWTEEVIANGTDVTDNFSVAIDDYRKTIYLYGGNKQDNSKSGKLWKYVLGSDIGWEMIVGAISASHKLTSHKMIFDNSSNTLYIAGGMTTTGKNSKLLLAIDLDSLPLTVEEKKSDEQLIMGDEFSISINMLGYIYFAYINNSSKNTILSYNIVSEELKDLNSSLKGDGLDLGSGAASAVESMNNALYIYNALLERMSKIILN